MFGLGEKGHATSEQKTVRQPTVFGLRHPAQMSRIYGCKLMEISGNESDAAMAAREVAEVSSQLAKLEKDISRMDGVPDSLTDKLATLKARIAVAREIESRHTRIAKSRREVLDSWLSEGSPTNRELIERDRAESEALR